MHLEVSQDVAFILTYGVGIVILSIISDRKNRNPLGWGLFGGLFFPCTLIFLAFLPRLCPKCKGDCMGNTCPNCKMVMGTAAHCPTTRPWLNAASGGVH
jgi:hypothetical protein